MTLLSDGGYARIAQRPAGARSGALLAPARGVRQGASDAVDDLTLLVDDDSVQTLVRASASPTPWLAAMIAGASAGFALGVDQPALVLSAVTVGGVASALAFARWSTWRRIAATVADEAQRHRQAAAEVDEVARIRAAFLSGVSHELRTPLTTIIGYGETVQAHRDRIEPERMAQLTDSMVSNAQRLERLVLDLLEVNQMSPVSQPPPTMTRVDVLIDDVLASIPIRRGAVSVIATSKPMSLIASVVRRIVRELVHNAGRHTPPGTPVRVIAESDDGSFVLTVEDDGPGIDADLCDVLFSPFVQGRRAAAEPKPGLGIGLALVRRYAERVGGHVVHETPVDGGTRIRVTLPAPIG